MKMGTANPHRCGLLGEPFGAIGLRLNYTELEEVPEEVVGAAQ